ncbi:hypothetical protein RvY_05341 [Ramazzottius varieornatus]|uniref:AAA+ ATPase domain-containing protein n=1 Tax=Ramazzottius varieornatus TaxID=947166 RepID=A0A1D1UVA9_RAMVA|nr:hypothetical protein RvY_05341 [Ramazzottius varieornatus]
MEYQQAEEGEENYMLVDHDGNVLDVDMHQFVDCAQMNKGAVSNGLVECEAESNGCPASDESGIYRSLCYENAFSYPEWLQQEDDWQRSGRRPQLFRPVVAIEPFLHAAAEQEQIASLANWHFQQYQMYANCMDQPLDRGGLNNHLDMVATRMEGFQTTQASWETNSTYPELPTDKDLEEVVLTADEYSANYEQGLRQAYQAVELTEQQPFSRRTLVPKKAVLRNGLAPFQPPARNSLLSATSAGSANSHAVMQGFDELFDGDRPGRAPQDLPGKNSSSDEPRAFSRKTSKQDGKDEFDEKVPMSTRTKSGEFKTAKQYCVETSLAKSTALPRGISDDSTGKPTDAYKVPIDRPQPAALTPSPSKYTGTNPKLQHLTADMVASIEQHKENLDKMKAGRKENAEYFEGISGLDDVKSVLYDMFIMPTLHPELSKGLLAPPKGLLLFGPPGTGKTLIAKCVAAEVEMTFFHIPASTLTSKWIGEGEKMMKAAFEVARAYLPAIIFFDEVDSLLSQRGDSEHEASRRMKTEFLMQFDGLCTDPEERLFVIGATNRPKEIDEAARRRFTKRLYIPLPDKKARIQIVQKELKTGLKYAVTEAELDVIGEKTEGFSGSDVSHLCHDAAQVMRKRCLPPMPVGFRKPKAPLDLESFVLTGLDFDVALQSRKSSVDVAELQSYIDWNAKFGTGSM